MGVLKGAFTHAWSSLVDGFNLLWKSIYTILPNLVIALLVLIIGSIVAFYIGDLITSIIKKAKVDKPIETILSPVSKLSDTKINSSKLVGETVKWILLISVLVATFNLLGLRQVVTFFNQLLSYLPNIFIGVFMMVVGSLVATFVASLVAIITKQDYLTNISRFAVNALATIAAITIIFTPVASALGSLLAHLPMSGVKSDALFIGLVVLFVFAFKDMAVKIVQRNL